LEEGFVFYPQDYVFSSTGDYAGGQGLLKGVVVVKIFTEARDTREDWLQPTATIVVRI
jgi:hypothetical protein